jgi:hypothetical protein
MLRTDGGKANISLCKSMHWLSDSQQDFQTHQESKQSSGTNTKDDELYFT